MHQSPATHRAFVRALLDAIPKSTPTLFNPWRSRCQHDLHADAPDQRIERLSLHLHRQPRFILVGEAPGYQGARYSGTAFTSERLLGDGAIPGIPRLTARLTDRPIPFSEPSATIVWRALYDLGIAEHTVLWNAVQLHPHQQGKPWSNRTPTDAELELGAPALRILLDHFPSALPVAIGRKAERTLIAMGTTPAACLRHPANGGATEFRAGLTRLISGAAACVKLRVK